MAYGMLDAFVASLPDDPLHGQLERAIRGKGAFRRFGDQLRPHDDEWARWHRFKDERDLARARACLASAGYRPAVQ